MGMKGAPANQSELSQNSTHGVQKMKRKEDLLSSDSLAGTGPVLHASQSPRWGQRHSRCWLRPEHMSAVWRLMVG